MSTIKDEEFDYQAYLRENPPDPAKVHHGSCERVKRREAAKARITIRIDQEVIEQFKKMTSEGRGYQNLINQALREWLVAQGVKELIREELSEMVDRVVASIQERQ